MQHALGVPRELMRLLHGGVLPEDELVVAEAVTGDELFVRVAPLDTAHLGTGVDCLDVCALESNAGSVRSESFGEEAVSQTCVVFQMRRVLSAVPPPLASTFRRKGHQESALTAAWCCTGYGEGEERFWISLRVQWLDSP